MRLPSCGSYPLRNRSTAAAFRLVMANDPILDAPRTVQDLHQQMNIQRETWRIQRVGWWILLLISIAGLVGFLGDGPVAMTTARSGDAAVQYDLVTRRDGDAHVRFEIPSRRGRAVLTLPSGYMEEVEIISLQPEPIVAFSGPDAHTFVFLAPHGRAQVALKVRPRKVGVLEFDPRVNGQALPTHHPLVLP